MVETMRWAETVATLTVPAAAIAMPAATTLLMLRRVRCARSRLLLLNHLATLMPPYPAGTPAVPERTRPHAFRGDNSNGALVPNGAISLIQPNKPVTPKQVKRLTFVTTTTTAVWL